MSSNKSAKNKLIELYGKECFIDKLKLRPSDDKTYYSSKKQYQRMKQLTYHHIRMKSKGGKATIENGALLSAENHSWFHKQPKAEQERMNNAFQEYKREVDSGTYTPARIEIADYEPPFEIELAELTIEDRPKVKKLTKAQRKRELRAKRKKEKKKLQKLKKEWEDR